MWMVVHSRPCARWTYRFCFPPPSLPQNIMLFKYCSLIQIKMGGGCQGRRSLAVVLFYFCVYCVYTCCVRVRLREVLACVCVNLRSWYFLLGFPSRIFPKEGFFKCWVFPWGMWAIPLNHRFVLPPALQVSGAWLYVSFLLC